MDIECIDEYMEFLYNDMTFVRMYFLSMYRFFCRKTKESYE